MSDIKENVPLAPYTVYKIGGPARYFTEVKNPGELEAALGFAASRGLEFFILGAGSNVLVSDRGFPGIAIKISGGEARAEGKRLVADAGVQMARAAVQAARAGLSGFEWAVGIPGTIGGSVRGNAGCFGGEMSHILERVRVCEVKSQKSKVKSTSQNLKLIELTNAECQFRYRDSVFKKHPEWIILSATFSLEKGDPDAIQENIRRISAERAAKQDIGAKCCGCIFKNVGWERVAGGHERLLGKFPEFKSMAARPNIPAGFLIESAGLKGARRGPVAVSSRHANFFVNEGGASAADAAALIEEAKRAVFERYGIELEEEIQYVGF